MKDCGQKNFGRKKEKINVIAHMYIVSRKFIYKWLKRFRENLEGKWRKDRSSRPKAINRKADE